MHCHGLRAERDEPVQRFAEEDGKKRNNVSFALQILSGVWRLAPRRHQSLKRRRERLEAELAEARLVARGGKPKFAVAALSEEVLNHLDEYGQDEIDDLEELIFTGATTAETVEQLGIEVQTRRSRDHGVEVLYSGTDTKWQQRSYSR